MSEKRLKRLDHETTSESGKKIYQFLQSRIVGQDRALRALVRAMERRDSPFRDKRKPIGSFLFLGPSRSGKTETARALAMHLFGDREALTYIDCTKFNSSHEVAMLKGSPPGYVGFIESGRKHDNPYPLLSRWNVYKHHHKYLEEKHQQEIDEIIDQIIEAHDLKAEVDKLAKTLRGLLDDGNDIIRRRGSDRHRIIALKAKKDLSEAEKAELSALRNEAAELEERWKKTESEIHRVRDEMRAKRTEAYELEAKAEKEHREASKKGWFYDPDNPPEDLLGIVVFDEIEKADTALMDHLMEITDTGQFQCDNGEVTPMKNCIIVMTSNAGQERISAILNTSSQIGFKRGQPAEVKNLEQQIYETATEELKNNFRLEFLNRLDKIVVFQPLGTDAMFKILEIRIGDLKEDIARSGFKIKLVFDQSARNLLVEKSMTRVEQGAGLLEKRLTDFVRDSLVVLCGTGQVKEGDTVIIRKNPSSDELEFYKEEN